MPAATRRHTSRAKKLARLTVNMTPEMHAHLEAVAVFEGRESVSDLAHYALATFLYGLGARLRAAEALVTAQSAASCSTNVLPFAAAGGRR